MRRVIVLLVSAALVLSGCGSSDTPVDRGASGKSQAATAIQNSAAGTLASSAVPSAPGAPATKAATSIGCQLITASEVNRTLGGTKFGEPHEVALKGGGTSCQYRVAGDTDQRYLVDISIHPNGTELFVKARDLAKALSEHDNSTFLYKEVPELGNEAHFAGGVLDVLKGRNFLAISIVYPDASQEVQRQGQIQIAKIALSRM